MMMINQVLTFVALFPAFLPIWQERPLSSADVTLSPAPYEVTAEVLAVQREALRSNNPDVRLVSAQDLGRTGNAQAAAVLAATLRTEKNSRVLGCVLQQLALSPAELVNELDSVVTPLLSHESRTVRYWAVRLFSRLADVSVLPLQKVVESDNDPAVRGAAWDGLRARADRVNKGFLKTQIESDDLQERAAALRVAAQRSGMESELIKGAADDSPLVRSACAAGLTSIATPHVRKLADLLIKDAHAAVRVQASSALAARTGDDVIPYLIKLSADPDSQARRWAVSGLGKYSGQPCVEAVIVRLSDKHADVAQAAEDAAVVLHKRTPLDQQLVAVLAGQSERGRYHAVRALGRIGARNQATVVQAALGRETAGPSIAAVVCSLGRLQVIGAVEDVAKLVNNRAPVVRREVAVALGSLKQPAGCGTLVRLASDSDVSVRLAALEAMGRFGDGNAFNATLVKVLKNYKQASPEERAVACWSAVRVRPRSQDVARAMLTLGTKAVIPMEMSPPAFDSEQVLVSVSLGLTEIAQDEPWAKPMYEQVLALHSKAMVPGVNMSPSAFTPSSLLLDAARQARAYMAGSDSPKPGSRPLEHFDFHYESSTTKP